MKTLYTFRGHKGFVWDFIPEQLFGSDVKILEVKMALDENQQLAASFVLEGSNPPGTPVSESDLEERSRIEGSRFQA